MIRTLPTDKWTWIAERDGKVIGTLMAAPLHNNIVFLERFKMEDGDAITGLKLIRECLDECFLRGYRGFITTLDPTRKVEGRLMAVARKRYGCYVSTNIFILVAGSTLGKLSKEERDTIARKYQGEA